MAEITRTDCWWQQYFETNKWKQEEDIYTLCSVHHMQLVTPGISMISIRHLLATVYPSIKVELPEIFDLRRSVKSNFIKAEVYPISVR